MNDTWFQTGSEFWSPLGAVCVLPCATGRDAPNADFLTGWNHNKRLLTFIYVCFSESSAQSDEHGAAPVESWATTSHHALLSADE